MQSSLLALMLANDFFPGEEMVALVASVSLVVMILGGFGMVLLWQKMDARGA